MNNEPTRYEILVRFGYIGLWLYKRLHKKPKWKNKNFILIRYSITFFIVFIPVLLLGEFFVAQEFYFLKFWGLILFLIFYISVSVLYGYWAQYFFSKYI